MDEKDMVKAQRLNEAYKHLFAHHGVKSQKHLAEILRVQRTGLSSAFNGSKANLTKNLFVKICAAFPGVFNLDYFLRGEGTLLTVEEDAKSSEIEKESNPQQPSPYIDKFLASLEKQIKDKDDQLADKERIIKLLEQKIEVLEAMQHLDSANPLKDYPFAIGASEGENYSNVSPNKI
jgi:transcriptional regulator with XRE-family HTH domain